MAITRTALRGEIWWVQVPTDPPEKGRRTVVVVSSDGRNRHERASAVLVVPLSTSVHKDCPTHTLLQPGETGLAERCVAQSENVTVVRKEELFEHRERLRQLSHSKICEIADKVKIAMGVLPNDEVTG
jgi:mRNA-degrading endonuclease toxin of MazEF toxin-antitoxin module